MSNNKLNVLFVPIDATGHVNPCIGIAEQLIADGHRVSFVVKQRQSSQLSSYGIEEVLVTPSPYMPRWADSDMINSASPEQKVDCLAKEIDIFANLYKHLDEQLVGLLPAIRPDVIVLNRLMTLPAVESYGVPCVWCWSTSPLVMVDHDRTPPGHSGLSATGDQRLWREFRQLYREAIRANWQTFNDWVVGRGCEPLPEHRLYNGKHYLNIYAFPQELDYQDIRPLGRNYVRFDHFKRTERHMTFAVPPELAAKPGALVYFSMGTIVSGDVSNQRRLVAILAKSPHRFIVSMGPKHKEYTLADNMWGAASVPQTRVLPLVDLVITHGGVNTVTESLYFGRPMIAMPVFSEQYDNAQRLHDKGFGLRLDAYKCSEEELLAAIETLLNDKAMAERLAEISRRIQTDNSLSKVSQLIEDFAQNPRKYID